jgi:hypothetical protein
VVVVASLEVEIEAAGAELLEDVVPPVDAAVDAVVQLVLRAEPELSLSLGDATRVSLWPEERKTCKDTPNTYALSSNANLHKACHSQCHSWRIGLRRKAHRSPERNLCKCHER